jgi:peroxiredoxin
MSTKRRIIRAIEERFLEKRRMFKENRKTRFSPPAAVLVMVLAAAAILTGCKKESPEPPASASLPADTPQTKESGEKTDPAAKPDANSVAGSRPSLGPIIRAARTWGPAYESWYGKTAPDFALKDLAGREHKLSDYRGKKVMVVFWATWCPPCKMEVPDLVKLRNDLAEDKLAMLAISAEKADLLARFVEQKINYTVLLDTGNMPTPFGFMRIYQTIGVPCSFFIDSEGKIILATSGLISLNELKAIIEAI